MDYWFAENLRKYRKQRGLTQQRLADMLGVRRETVTCWETCDRYPRINQVYDISRVLEIDVELLLKRPIRSSDKTNINKY